MSQMLIMGLQIVALALLAIAIAAAVAAVLARSLFVMCVNLAAAGAACAGAVLALGADEGALGIALLGAALAPVLLLAVVLFGKPTAKPRPRTPWFSLTAALALTAALSWPLRTLGPAAPTAPHDTPGLGFWIAPLLLVAAAACAGLLGYGERGALERRK